MGEGEEGERQGEGGTRVPAFQGQGREGRQGEARADQGPGQEKEGLPAAAEGEETGEEATEKASDAGRRGRRPQVRREEVLRRGGVRAASARHAEVQGVLLRQEGGT